MHKFPLSNVCRSGMICGTNSLNGNRSRYPSGIFLSQIHHSTGEHRPQYIEFAIRSIRRDKADFIRTNKASLFSEVVEAVSHPIKGDTYPKNLFTKTLNTMKNPTQTAALMPTLTPVFSNTGGSL